MDRIRTRPSALAASLVALVLAVIAPGTLAQDGADEPRTQVATIFDQPVYLENLTPPEVVVQANRERIGNDKEFKQWLEVQRVRILRDLTFKMLSNAYMQENGITASEDEINDFLRQEKEVYEAVLAQYARELQEAQLEAQRIHAEGRTVPPEVEQRIRATQNKIDVLERKNVERMVISEKQRRLHDDIQRQRVSRAIRSWKFNRLLHDQFGGRVITERDNLTYVPYEAYAAWLQTQHDLGNFAITDEDLDAAFWAYYAAEPEGAMEPFDGMWDRLRWANSGLP